MTSRDDLYEQSITLLERLAGMSKDGSGAQDLTTLKDHMEYYCASKQRYRTMEQITSQAVNDIEQVKTAEDSKAIMAEFNKKLQQLSKIDGKKDQKYLDFVESLGTQLENEDEDICTVQETRSVIDPISKQRMVDPVKNKQCGHCYEKTAVLKMIAKNPRTRCPMVGCSANSFINKNDLIPDNDLKRYLAITLNQSMNKSGFDGSNIVSLDDTQ